MTNEQNFNYIKPLVDLGMKAQEARIYLACLRLGQTTVSKIASEANIQRTFVYGVLEDLQKIGIVSSIEIKGKKNYSAISIERFKEMQYKKFARFESIVPEIKSLEKTVGDRPKVRFFEGSEGIITGLNDTLNQRSGSEILSYATAEGFYASNENEILSYIKKRVSRKISMRTIAPNNKINQDWANNDEGHLRQTILVPEDKYPFTNEINIYDNKVLILSLQGELLAIIIESESVTKTQRAIFELAWLGAEKLNNIQ